MSDSEVNFRRVRDIPPEQVPQFDGAIRDFMAASQMNQGIDVEGFRSATIESIASSTYLNGSGADLWIGTFNNALVTYVLATITREVDNRLTYWVFQAWVRPDQRGKRWVKEAWQAIRTRAKETLCSHIVVVSSRDDGAYCRWLGKGWHRYATLLKEDLNG